MSLQPLIESSFVIQVHAASAVAALVLGAVILWRQKGTPLHKALGKVWIGLMLVVATSALFINEIRMIGPFSPIHIFSMITYAGVVQGLYHIRRGEVTAHRAAMQGLYLGALILAGAFTFLPGRRMHEVLFGPGAGMAESLMVIVPALGLAGWFWWRLMPKRELSRRPSSTP